MVVSRGKPWISSKNCAAALPETLDPNRFRDSPRFFGRRRGKTLRDGQQDLLKQVLPRCAIALPEGTQPLPPQTLFEPSRRAFWLEIGFGGGEHLAAQAQAHPDVGLIGSEVFVNGIASLLRHVEEKQVSNVRVWPEDVRRLWTRLPDKAFERIFVLFPDPWPKTRHSDRRFIGPANLPDLSRLLADGGELRVASDDMNYIDWSLSHLLDHPDFTALQASEEDRYTRPADWQPTRYEAKALRQGKSCCYLRFQRKVREG